MARTPSCVPARMAPREPHGHVTDMDELDYAIRLRMMQDSSLETVTLRHHPKQRALPIRQFASFLPGTGIGGAGEQWQGWSPRFPPDSFELRTRTLGSPLICTRTALYGSCSNLLRVEEFANESHRFRRALFHQPMPGATDDRLLNIGRNVSHDHGLEWTKGFLSANGQHGRA